MQRKGLSSLYSEPYYPPGYCGYTPQFHFQFGETYGKTTSRLLKDPSVSKSQKSVLVDVYPKEKHDEDHTRQTNETNRNPLNRLSWGDRKFTDQMVPGYTGYIPLGENKIGSRYAKLCQDAVLVFRQSQQAAHENRKRLTAGQRPPLKQRCSDSAPYVSTHQVQHSLSPYKLSENDAGKTFMSGYTGFIPRSRARFATGYPQLTMQALRDFTREQKQTKLNATLQVDLSGTKLPAMQAKDSNGPSQSIYVKNGLLPQYTGYLPGHKFRFGETFGTSARYFHSTNCTS